MRCSFFSPLHVLLLEFNSFQRNYYFKKRMLMASQLNEEPEPKILIQAPAPFYNMTMFQIKQRTQSFNFSICYMTTAFPVSRASVRFQGDKVCKDTM